MKKIKKITSRIFALVLASIVLFCGAALASEIPEETQEQNAVTILGDNNNKDKAKVETDVQEMSLKEYMIAKLQEAHRNGQFLNLDETVLQKMSDAEIEQLLKEWREHLPELITGENINNLQAVELSPEQEELRAFGTDLIQKVGVKKLLLLSGISGVALTAEFMADMENAKEKYYRNKDLKKAQDNFFKQYESNSEEAIKETRDAFRRLQKTEEYKKTEGTQDITWAVINDPRLNARCDGENSIRLTEGIVNKMLYDECGEKRKYGKDLLMAVCGHEIKHGLNDDMPELLAEIWNNGLEGGGNALSCANETDADLGACKMVAAAGGNPGAVAAMTYILEGDANPDDKTHPSMEKRRADAISFLTEYSGGRVTIKEEEYQEYGEYFTRGENGSITGTKKGMITTKRLNVYKDGKLMKTGASGEDTCLYAGQLAKDCHDGVI